MSSDPAKKVIIVGGPNGAGKTSWAMRHLIPTVAISEFLNADEIARGLSPLDPEASAIAAGRLMIDRLNAVIDEAKSFAFETTCSGRGHVRLIEKCRRSGYEVTLVYLWLPSAESAVARVRQRVREGGHRIPDDVIVRRYAAGLRNMRQLYLPLADRALIYDNSDQGGVLIAERRPGSSLNICDESRWMKIEEATR